MRIKDMVLVSLFAALTAAGAFIKVNISFIPFTFQLFFCALSGVMLGARLGALSQLIYIVIGLSGIPVFSQGGGITYIFKPSFGYIIGFVFTAYIIGRFSEKNKNISLLKLFFIQLTGLFVLYIFGTVYMYLIMNFYLEKSMTIIKILNAAVFPFVLIDTAKIFLVSIIGIKIKPIIKKFI